MWHVNHLLLTFFLLCGLLLPLQAANHPAISRITIRGTDIFDFETKPNLQKFPYTWINFLHLKTKEGVIRQQLLFKEGDKLDVFLLRETERNLRGLSFIRAARCVTFPQRDGTVAVVVHVNDSWTTEPQINASGTNGVDSLQFGFKEKNFLGFGKTIDYFHTKKNDVNTNEFGYFDPNVLGSRWQAEAEFANADNDSSSRDFRIARPFYATDVEWSAFASNHEEDAVVETFVNNVKVSEFKQVKEVNEASIGKKVGHQRELVNHAALRYRRDKINAEQTDEPIPAAGIPAPELRQVLFLDLESFRNKFVEESHLEKMVRIEDVNLGATIKASPGYSPRDLTGNKPSTEFLGLFEKFSRVGQTHLIQTKFSYSSRNTLEKEENTIYRVELKDYFRKWPMQTLVAHGRLEWGERLDADTRIELGSENGLRAYKNVAFRGTKSLLFNLEDRFYFSDEIADLFTLGAAAFVDSGYVWERQNAVDLGDLRTSMGVGLRVGLTRSSNEAIFRLDLSRRLKKAPGDNDDWVFTFGSDQAF